MEDEKLFRAEFNADRYFMLFLEPENGFCTEINFLRYLRQQQPGKIYFHVFEQKRSFFLSVFQPNKSFFSVVKPFKEKTQYF